MNRFVRSAVLSVGLAAPFMEQSLEQAVAVRPTQEAPVAWQASSVEASGTLAIGDCLDDGAITLGGLTVLGLASVGLAARRRAGYFGETKD